VLGLLRFGWWSLRGRWERVATLCVGLLCISTCTTLLAGFTQLSTLTATRQVSHSWRTSYDLLVRTPDALSPTERQLQAVDPGAPEQTYGGISLSQVNTIAHISHVDIAAPEAVVGWVNIRPYVPISLTQPGIYRVTTELVERGTASYATQVTRIQHLFVVLPLALYARFAGEQTAPDVTYLSLGTSGTTTVAATWTLPTLLAGIDPRLESRLVGLQWQPSTNGTVGGSGLPLLMNTHPWTALTATVTVEQARLSSVDMTRLNTTHLLNKSLSWTIVVQHQFDERSLLLLVAHELGIHDQQSLSPLQGGGVTRYARVGYVQNMLTPSLLDVLNVGSDASGPLTRFPLLPQATTPWIALNGGTGSFTTFDSTKLPIRNDSLAVPLGLYQPEPVGASPGLFPQRSVVPWPPLLFTTINAACTLTGVRCISAVRVRVAGLGSFGQRSESLLQQVAMDIEGRTGLHVDVVTGASGRPLTMRAAPGAGPQPTFSEIWTQPYVAVTITNGVNTANILLLLAAVSVALLALIAAALLTASGRKSDVLLLLETGWSRRLLLFEAVLEAGVAALLAALPVWISSFLLTRLGVPEVPLSALLSVLSGAIVLYIVVVVIATRTAFLTRERGMKRKHRAWTSGSWWWMMFRRQVSWRRGSAALVVVSIMGACGLVSFMLLVQSAIDSILYATLLGRQVQVSLSSVHGIAACLTCTSAMLTAGLTLLLVVRERLPELSVLLAIGWTRRSIAFEIAREGVLLGLFGGLLGGVVAEVFFISLYHVWSLPLFAACVAAAGLLGSILCALSAVYPVLLTLWLLSRRILMEE